MLLTFRFFYFLGIMAAVSACSTSVGNVRSSNPMVEAQSYYDSALYSDAERVLLRLSKQAKNNYDVHFMLGNISLDFDNKVFFILVFTVGCNKKLTFCNCSTL